MKRKRGRRKRGRRRRGRQSGGAWRAQVQMAANPNSHPPGPPPGPPPGHLSVSGPSSVLSRDVGGSRLAGPWGGGSPSSGEASTPVGAAGRSGLAGRPFGTETPQWRSVSSAME